MLLGEVWSKLNKPDYMKVLRLMNMMLNRDIEENAAAPYPNPTLMKDYRFAYTALSHIAQYVEHNDPNWSMLEFRAIVEDHMCGVPLQPKYWELFR